MYRYGLAVGLAALLAACTGDSPTDAGTGTPTPAPTPVATSIDLSGPSSLTGSELTFASLTATAQLTATVKDQNGTAMAGATVTWATSDASVATVSTAGLVTSVADGAVAITATSGSASAEASLEVIKLFELGANGVTVMCPRATVGDTGEVGAVTYTCLLYTSDAADE